MENNTATIRNAMPSFVNNPQRCNDVVVKLKNNVTAPMTNGGAQQKAKKVYAPNLNVVRSKNKDKEIAKKTIEKNTKIIAARNEQRKPKDEGRYIQSQGLFSDGAGEMKRLVRNHNGDTDRQYNSRSTEDSMHKPKVEMNNRKIDKGTEDCVVNNLLDCDDPNFLDQLSRDYEPIVLPLSANNKPFLEIFCVTPKVDLVVKQEHVCQEKETVRGACANILFDTQEILHEAPKFLNCGKYTDEDPFISLIRLPDTFPAKGFSDKPIPNDLPESTSARSNNTEQIECGDFNVNMFGEGQLGTILVHKSGKIEIKIGPGNYILQSSGESTCTEEAMVIPNNSNDSKQETEISCQDEMIVLGDIKEHLTLSPSWQQLFLDKMSEKKRFGYQTS